MIQLHDAITKAFPQGNEWAAQALEALSDELEPTTLVHGVVEGWMRRGDGPEVELVDTLFILTSVRLGMGRTDEAPGERRWIDLGGVVAVDAVDDSPLPLQTIELELNDGLVLCVGWPEWFSERLVPVLLALAEGAGIDEASADAMPRELSDPTGLVHDASDLETLAPSGWVEGDVAVDDDTTSASADTPPDAPSERKVVAALDFFNPPAPSPVSEADLEAAPEFGPLPDPVGPPVVFEPFAVDPAVARPFEADPRAFDADPRAFDADPRAFDAVPSERPADPSWTTIDARLDDGPLAPDAFEPSSDRRDAPARDESFTAGPPPWEQPGMVWPDPLRGVLYLGGHPGHPRKRKNGTMVFSPAGIDVTGSGFQSWEMNLDWAFVNGMEIQGPDEIMFAEHLKIDSTSSALIVAMVDETRMFFEIRTRRPPSLRAALAPVLLMVENIRSHRAGNG